MSFLSSMDLTDPKYAKAIAKVLTLIPASDPRYRLAVANEYSIETETAFPFNFAHVSPDLVAQTGGQQIIQAFVTALNALRPMTPINYDELIYYWRTLPTGNAIPGIFTPPGEAWEPEQWSTSVDQVNYLAQVTPSGQIPLPGNFRAMASADQGQGSYTAAQLSFEPASVLDAFAKINSNPDRQTGLNIIASFTSKYALAYPERTPAFTADQLTALYDATDSGAIETMGSAVNLGDFTTANISSGLDALVTATPAGQYPTIADYYAALSNQNAPSAWSWQALPAILANTITQAASDAASVANAAAGVTPLATYVTIGLLALAPLAWLYFRGPSKNLVSNPRNRKKKK